MIQISIDTRSSTIFIYRIIQFLQVGGITFAFDPSKAPGSRIDPAFIKIGSEYMDKDQHYKMATKAALASGEEGYTALSQGHLAHYVRDAFYSLEELLLPVFMFIIYALQEWF